GYGAMVAVYWKPVYKYIRLKWRIPLDEAQDTTQEFFARAIEKSFFESYDASKARFRTFLRLCLDRFIANERKASARMKRGGGQTVVPPDFPSGEGELLQHDVALTPDLDEYFHREWIRSLFALAVDDLRREYEAAGKRRQFRVFERYDLEAPAGGIALTYSDVAAECDVSPADVTNHLLAARRPLRRAPLPPLGAL